MLLSVLLGLLLTIVVCCQLWRYNYFRKQSGWLGVCPAASDSRCNKGFSCTCVPSFLKWYWWLKWWSEWRSSAAGKDLQIWSRRRLS